MRIFGNFSPFSILQNTFKEICVWHTNVKNAAYVFQQHKISGKSDYERPIY